MIYYIGHYTRLENFQNRKIFHSATNKMTYIINCIKKNKIPITVVSMAITKDHKSYSAADIQLDTFSRLIEFKTFGRRNMFTKLLDIYGIKVQLLCYLLKNVGDKDTVILYHASQHEEIVFLAKRIKKFRLVLEVEELYGDVDGNERLKSKELVNCSKADAFIVPTQFIDREVNPKNKPTVVIHGAYQVEAHREQLMFENDSQHDKVHIIYAGTFDPRKGSTIAVATAEFLPSNYHIHILGFGSDADKQILYDMINQVNKSGGATVTMDGFLMGEEYIRFIQNCDIGLSPQATDAVFNETSFPSKILSYMANGLRVVSVRIPAIEQSAIGKYLYYYDKDTPQNVAEAILSVDINDSYNGRNIVLTLDRQFQRTIIDLLECYNELSEKQK